ncbi:hypothetical protein ACXYN8_08670 [Altererythrobacter sp. CAU 1778]
MAGSKIVERIARLRRGRALPLGLALAMSQFGTLAFLLAAKLRFADEDFAQLVLVIGVASILGAVATWRLEVLLYHAQKVFTRLGIVLPVLLSVFVVSLAAYALTSLVRIAGYPLPLWGALYALALAWQAIGQFMLVQQQRLGMLLLIRGAQFLSVCAAAVAVFLNLPFESVVLGFALANLVPSGLWLLAQAWRARSVPGTVSRDHALPLAQRSAMRTLTIFVNTFAANIPVILCVSTQTSAYAADFGFLLKLFGPLATFATTVFGQMFLADIIGYDVDRGDGARLIRSKMRQTTRRALAFVAIAAIVVAASVLVIAPWIDLVADPVLAIPIACAIVFQASFAPIGNVGDVARVENELFVLFAARAVVVYLVLGSTLGVDYASVFAVLNLVSYASFWLFCDWRIRRREALAT